MKLKKEVIKKIVLGVSVFLGLALLLLILFKTGIFGKKVDLEAEMTTMVSSFYDKNIKGKIIGVHKQIVTLKDLQGQEYDISNFLDAKCSLESYSYVILDDPNETDITKINYTIEHNLNCEKK